MADNERRFRKRYDAAPLKLEISKLNLFGRAGKRHQAIARDFSLGGVSIVSPIKMKAGKDLLISLTSDDHSLQSVPATVIRAEQQDGDFVYAIKFSMGKIPEAASRGAYTILQRLEINLREAGNHA